MYLEPEIEVSCDGEYCCDSVLLPMAYRGSSWYLAESIGNNLLVDDHDWQVVDGKHYCPSCKEDV